MRRVLGVLGAVVGTTVTFVGATAAGVLIHLDRPATRRVAAHEIGQILRSTFKGSVDIERVTHLGLDGVRGVRAKVNDPTGKQVLLVDGVRADLSAVSVLKSVVFGKGDIDLTIRSLDIDYVDANLEEDGSDEHQLRLLRAFESRDESPPKPKDPNARGLRLEFARVGLAHGWVHGPVDADADRLAGGLLIAPKETRVDVNSLHVVTRGLPNGFDVRGDAGAHLAMPSKSGKDMGITGRFTGSVGDVVARLGGEMDGDRVDAVVDAERASAMTAHAEAHGELSKLVADAQFTAGKGTANLHGVVALGGDRTHVQATVDARDIDAHAFRDEAPVSRLGAKTEVEISIGPPGILSGKYTLDVLPGEVAGNEVPAAHFKGSLTERSGHLEGHIAERGAPVDLVADMEQRGQNHVVDFSLSGQAPAIQRIPRIKSMVAGIEGALRLRARGTVDVEGQTFDARLEANVQDFAYQDTATIGAVAVDGHASGTFSAPRIDANAHAVKVSASGHDFEDVRVSGSVGVAGGVAVKNAHVTVRENGVTMDTRAARIALAGSTVRVDGVVIDGLGAPAHASLVKTARGLRVRADSKGIDLARVGRLVDLQDKVSGGILAFTVDARLEGESAKGNVKVDLEGASVAALKDGKLHMAATLDDRDMALDMDANLADAGRVRIKSTRVKLGRGKGALDPKAWKDAVGSLAVDADVDLQKLAAMVPERSMPFSEIQGALALEGTIKRDSVDVPPEVRISTKTHGLVLAARSPEEPPPVGSTKVVEAPAWRLEGVDAGVDVRVDATSGHAEAAARLFDVHGTLASFDAKADVPYSDLWKDSANALPKLENSPFDVRLDIPRRKLAELPPLAGTKGVPGAVEATLTARGTAHDPRVELKAQLIDYKGAATTFPQGITTDVTANYDGRRATADVRVLALRGADANAAPPGEVLAAKADANLDVEDLLARHAPAWDANFHANLHSFPLESVGPVGERQIAGRVHGEVSVEGIHRDARARARIDIEKLSVGQAHYAGGFIQAALDGRAGATAVVRLNQERGYFEARGKAGASWGAELAPTLRDDQPVEGQVTAQGFRVAALKPFLAGAVSELDGYLDANAQAHLDPKSKDAKLRGHLAYRNGLVNVPAIGEELRGIAANVDLSEDGRVRVSDVVAHGSEGKLSAEAEAKLAGLKLETASGKVHIGETDAMPLTLQGEQMGTIYGDVHVDVKASPDGRQTTMRVDIPSLHTKLPPTPTNSVQGLETRDDVRVGVERQRDKLTRLPLDQEDYEALREGDEEKTEQPSVTVIDVHLGKDVEIRRSTDVRIAVTGNPRIRAAAKTEMSGQLQLVSGFIELQGKKLEIERGTVSFVGPPDNPELVVTARWNAPDGTMVYADFVGPLKTGKVNLRSEPPRPKNEIMALLMFGTAEGSESTPYPQRQPNGTVRAVGMGGSYATQGLNKGIEDLAGTDRITAKIDTTQSANPRPELEFQLARSLSLKVGHTLGVPPLDRPDRNLIIVDWRLRRNWTLETTFGDRGTSILDAVWRHRY